MEGDALNAKQFCSGDKTRPTGRCRWSRRFSGKAANRRQPLKNRCHFLADRQLRLLAGFHPKIRRVHGDVTSGD
jgi:hypothetical protein